jgi:hypothetical protein
MILVITIVVFFGLMLILGFTLVMMGITDNQGLDSDIENEVADKRILHDELDVHGTEDRSAEFFRGKTIHTSRQASITWQEIEALLRDGHVRAALPWLLMICGLLGLVISIGPLLWYLLDEKWVAYVWMAAVAYALINIGWQYVRNNGG